MRIALAIVLTLAAAGTVAQPLEPGESREEAARRAARERFSARHPWQGRNAKEVVQRMRAEGFRCALEFRSEAPEFAPRPRALRDGRVAVLFCSKWDPSPGLDCIEERVSFDIDVVDVGGEAEELRSKVETAPVLGQSYICVPSKDGPAR